MGLLEKLFYTVEEVAKRWNKPVDDLWHFATDGKLLLSIWHKGYCFDEDFEWEPEPDFYYESEEEEEYPEYDRPSNVKYEATALDGIIDITKESALEFITLPLKEFINTSYLMINNKPRVLAFRTSTMDMPCSDIRECFIPETVKIEKKMVVIALKEVKRMEEKYPELLIKAPEQLSAQHATQSPSVVPREAEKPLRTFKAIAEYCGYHEDNIKYLRKTDKTFPVSPSGRGRVTALPSELNAWLSREIRK
jgi:hypothetical protein